MCASSHRLRHGSSMSRAVRVWIRRRLMHVSFRKTRSMPAISRRSTIGNQGTGPCTRPGGRAASVCWSTRRFLSSTVVQWSWEETAGVCTGDVLSQSLPLYLRLEIIWGATFMHHLQLNPKVSVSIVFVAALFMSIMDTTIVNVALPSIARQLGVSADSLDAIVVGYMVSLAVIIPVSGWLGDRFGTKRIFL